MADAAGHFVFDWGLGKGEKRNAMNLKRWFLWLCLAVIVVGEVMLYRANQQRDDARVERDTARHEAQVALADLEQFKASAAAAQGAEGDRLRQANQNLTQAITRLKSETNRLQQASRQLTQQLAALGDRRLRVVDGESAYLPLNKQVAAAETVLGEVKSLLQQE